MARPVCNGFCRDRRLISLLQRSRPRRSSPGQDGDTRAPVLIKPSASRAAFNTRLPERRLTVRSHGGWVCGQSSDRVESLANHQLEETMLSRTDNTETETETSIRTDLRAIFVSLELSRTTWLVTSLSPGTREKMSKHSVPAGDIGGLLVRLRSLQERVRARRKQLPPLVVIQEAGLEGFWIHRVLTENGIESHIVDPASVATSRRRRRAKTDKLDGDTLVRTLLAYKRGEPRVCAMVRPPTHEEEDRRRLSRERRVLLKERVQHSNRIKGLLFGQGVTDYEPLGRDRRQRLAGLLTGDGRSLPPHLKAQIDRELDRLEMVIEQIKGDRKRVAACHRRGGHGDARASNADRAQRDRQRIRDCALDRVPISSLRQSQTGGCLRGPRADALAEWVNRSRAGSLEGRQSALAGHAASISLAVATPPTRLGSEPMVPGSS